MKLSRSISGPKSLLFLGSVWLACDGSTGRQADVPGQVEAEQEGQLSDTEELRMSFARSAMGMDTVNIVFPPRAAPAGTIVKVRLLSGVAKNGGNAAGGKVLQIANANLQLAKPARMAMQLPPPPPSGGAAYFTLRAKERDPRWQVGQPARRSNPPTQVRTASALPPGDEIPGGDSYWEVDVEESGLWAIGTAEEADAGAGVDRLPDGTGPGLDGGTTADAGPSTDADTPPASLQGSWYRRTLTCNGVPQTDRGGGDDFYLVIAGSTGTPYDIRRNGCITWQTGRLAVDSPAPGKTTFSGSGTRKCSGCAPPNDCDCGQPQTETQVFDYAVTATTLAISFVADSPDQECPMGQAIRYEFDHRPCTTSEQCGTPRVACISGVCEPRPVEDTPPPRPSDGGCGFNPPDPTDGGVPDGGPPDAPGPVPDGGGFPSPVWMPVPQPSPAPIPRADSAMVYDERRGRVLMYGGSSGFMTGYLDDTWEWDGASWWNRTTVPSPGPRAGHTMTYDSLRGVAVLFGRIDSGPADTWEWNGETGTWNERFASFQPPVRARAAMTYDPNSRKAIMFGGSNWFTGANHQDTWEWDGEQGFWAELAPRGTIPSARYGHALIHDGGGRVLMLGGYAPSPGIYLQDVWEWDQPGQSWIDRSPFGPRPIPRSLMSVALDRQRRRIVVFGGQSSSSGSSNDLWELDPDTATWRDVTPGNSPSPRHAAAMTYDQRRSRLVLFGGDSGGGPITRFGDLWER